MKEFNLPVPNPATLVPLGATVKPYGTVHAVGFITGERYYWLIDHRGVVSMMPADVIELGQVLGQEKCPKAPKMPCGWCGKPQTVTGIRAHFTDCSKRPKQ